MKGGSACRDLDTIQYKTALMAENTCVRVVPVNPRSMMLSRSIPQLPEVQRKAGRVLASRKDKSSKNVRTKLQREKLP